MIQLEAASIVASRTTNTAEGYTTNLKGSPVAKGKDASLALTLLPNVTKEEGTFKIRGIAVSEIYVDGVKISDYSELDHIAGEMIDKVQVRYVAGSNQNAGLGGGTISITLRRPPEGGYYGSLSADGEWTQASALSDGGIGGVINYRHKKLSIYDNLYADWFRYVDRSDQKIFHQSSLTLFKEKTASHDFIFRNRLSLGHSLGKSAQIGGSWYVATNRNRPKSTTTGDGVLSSVSNRDNTMVNEGTVKLDMPLNQKGASMSLAGDYFNRHNKGKSRYSDKNTQVAALDEKNNLDLWKASADLMIPKSRTCMWQFGGSVQTIKSSYTPAPHAEGQPLRDE